MIKFLHFSSLVDSMPVVAYAVWADVIGGDVMRIGTQ
jgi:hypothetical protein